jgi:hypothetical protein
MPGRWRAGLLVVVVVQAALAAALLLHPPLVEDLWPFPDTTQLTYVFMASILFAAAASTGWSALYGELHSLVGIALDAVVIFLPIVVYVLLLGPSKGGGVGPLWVGMVGTAAFGLWLLWRTWTTPVRDRRPTPRPVLAAFAVFVVGLLAAGSALVLGTPDVLPWNVTPELAFICGLIFLGAAAYFGYGLVRPSWMNAGGQLAGFLAYDLVLIVPFLARFPVVPDSQRLSLVVYTAVVVGSGVLAAWYLFVDPRTRMGRPRQTEHPL